MIKHVLLASILLALAPGLACAQGAGSGPHDRSAQADGPRRVVGARTGSREATLSGIGTTDRDVEAGTLGLTGSLGGYLSDPLLLGLRQTFNWSESRNREDSLGGSTRLFADYHFNLSGRLRPFVGGQLGYAYGDNVDNSWTAGPEVGLKYYFNGTTFILAQTEYQFFFEGGTELDDAFDDGSFVHTLGLGFNF